MNPTSKIRVRTAGDWKDAIAAELNRRGVSRYQFAEQAADAKVCTNYTASSLLAADGTVRGTRKPSFEIAIQLAELLGCELVLVMPRPSPKKRSKSDEPRVNGVVQIEGDVVD